MFCGLVFGSLSDDVPDLEDYLGPEIARGISRVLHKPVQILGRFKQTLPNNWKLYVENVRDTYHASLLHVFFTTFPAQPPFAEGRRGGERMWRQPHQLLRHRPHRRK